MTSEREYHWIAQFAPPEEDAVLVGQHPHHDEPGSFGNLFYSPSTGKLYQCHEGESVVWLFTPGEPTRGRHA